MEEKLKTILSWIIKEGIFGEQLGIKDVPEQGDNEWEQNEEWWLNTFGGLPPAPIASGSYLYFYTDNIGTDQITDKFGNTIEEDAEVEVVPCESYVKLYKIS